MLQWVKALNVGRPQPLPIDWLYDLLLRLLCGGTCDASLSAPRRFCAPSFLLLKAALLASLLLAAPHAQAGTYTSPNPYSGGTMTDTAHDNSVPPPVFASSTGYGATTKVYAFTPSQCSITVSGSPTATYTWQPDPNLPDGADPAPSAIMVQTCYLVWNTDSAQDGATTSGSGTSGIPGAAAFPSGPSGGGTVTGYSVASPSGSTVTVSCSPTLNYTGTTTSSSRSTVYADANVNYSVTPYPVTIAIGGTYDPTHGDYRVLTGQQITATVNGIPTGYTVTKYTWSSPSGTCFKTYDYTLPSNQLVALGSTDLSGPAAGSTTVAGLSFYDRVKEDLTVTCTVTMTAPDGKTTLNLTATSPQVHVLKPTATWGVDPKTVPANGTANSNQIGFHDDSTTSQSYGVNTTWYPTKLSVPSPFSGGQGCFAQLVTPSATITRTATGKGVSTYSLKILNAQGIWIAPGTGLDGSFPYAIGFTTDANGNLTGIASDSSWQASGTGASGDNPKGQETTSDVDNGGIMWTSSSISDSFTTWLMYKPDGGVWIPVKSATWKASGNASGGPSNWSATGNYTAPSPTDAKDPPQWNVVISGQQYRP